MNARESYHVSCLRKIHVDLYKERSHITLGLLVDFTFSAVLFCFGILPEKRCLSQPLEECYFGYCEQ